MYMQIAVHCTTTCWVVLSVNVQYILSKSFVFELSTPEKFDAHLTVDN